MSPVLIPSDSDFTLSNIPLGIFTHDDSPPRPCTRIGDTVISLSALFPTDALLQHSTLNPLFALGAPGVSSLRSCILSALSDLPAPALFPADQVQIHLPFAVSDYSDFYAGRNHAYTVGCLFRGEKNALQPNYEHLPVGYHGRASSVVVSGAQVRRPRGQLGAGKFGPTGKLDYELELGCVLGGESKMGEAVSVEAARERVVGYVLLNDWSTRDVQSWEYVPLGPFVSKSFATTISPWVVVPDALEPYRAKLLERWTKEPLADYLLDTREKAGFDINLEVEIYGDAGDGGTVAKTNSCNLLWSFEQMVAQQTVTGCPLRTGDLLGSGTISGTNGGEEGCLLEATRNGERAVKAGSLERRWLKDGDTVILRGYCGAGERRVGWGECSGKIIA